MKILKIFSNGYIKKGEEEGVRFRANLKLAAIGLCSLITYHTEHYSVFTTTLGLMGPFLVPYVNALDMEYQLEKKRSDNRIAQWKEKAALWSMFTSELYNDPEWKIRFEQDRLFIVQHKKYMRFEVPIAPPTEEHSEELRILYDNLKNEKL